MTTPEQDFNALVDRACADNPELPREFVEQLLLAQDSPCTLRGSKELREEAGIKDETTH
jgi:hypothetical protein